MARFTHYKWVTISGLSIAAIVHIILAVVTPLPLTTTLVLQTIAALGIGTLSMRPASVGPVKALLRRVNLNDVRDVMLAARATGAESVRPAIMDWLSQQGE